MSGEHGARVMRRTVAAVALLLVMASCGDDDAGSIFESTGPTNAASSSDTTTAAEDFDALEFIANADFSGEADPPASSVGSPDPRAAEAITADLQAGDVDLTGVEIWVFDVVGTADRLLVIEIGSAASSLADDPTGGDLFEVLAAAPSLGDHGVTRLVINYRDTDTEGPFVLTATIPMAALIEATAQGTDLSPDAIAIQVVRDVPTATTTTTAAAGTTTTVGSSALLVDPFNGSTTAAPLFGPGVMSSTVNADGQLAMTALVGGVIPTMYPDPIPDAVEITFDFNPQPADATAGFGAVVLSEDPSDGALSHYVLVSATPSAQTVTLLAWDDGWGTPETTTIPAGAAFGANHWNTMRLVVVGGSIDVFINEVFVTRWTGIAPATTGHWGPVIVGVASGDAMLVDNVRVEDAP